MSIPGLTFLEDHVSMPLMKLPVRTTVIEVAAGRVMFSPGSMMSAQQLASAGDVTDIVAPSFWHTDGGPVAAKVFPRARLWGPAGMREKHPGYTWMVLGEDAWPHADISVLPLEGMPKIRETCLYHAPSRSLLTVDLFFNCVDAKGLGARVIMGMFGTYGRFAVSRMFMMLVKDKLAFARSVAPLRDLDIAHVVPAHGQVVSVDAKERALAALRERKVPV